MYLSIHQYTLGFAASLSEGTLRDQDLTGNAQPLSMEFIFPCFCTTSRVIQASGGISLAVVCSGR